MGETMNVETIGQLGIAWVKARLAFRKAFTAYYKEPHRGRPRKDYEPERVALLDAECALEEAVDQFLKGQSENASKGKKTTS